MCRSPGPKKSHQHDVPVDGGPPGVRDLQIDVTTAAERGVQLAGLSIAGTDLPGSGRSRYDHAGASVETFVVLICVSGE